MKRPEKAAADRVREWLRFADEDFALAEHLLSEPDSWPAATAFHSQQAAEKYLKALLTWRAVDFPKSHDIGHLLDLLADVEPALVELLSDTSDLTEYAVDGRYPSPFPPLTPEDVKRAFSLARRVRDAVLAALKDFP